jgi:predicted nucleic acid-binding protein
VDDRAGLPLASDVLVLARQHSLTTYDATYLELALRLSAPLATLDRQLKVVAKAAGAALYAG